MRLADKYSPQSLSGIVGQKHTRKLQRLAANPFRCCMLFVGEPGIGKTSSALALAADLGCTDAFSGLHVIPCSELGTDVARELIRSLHLRPMAGNGWRVVILEELERLSPQCSTYLKVALEQSLPERCIVIATSNDTTGLQPALVERFGNALVFDSHAALRADGAALVAKVWATESGGAPLPNAAQDWGCRWEDGQWRKKLDRYSLRAALDAAQMALLDLDDEPALAGKAVAA